jgi:NADH-quinone oxidoreductase subunit K
MDNLTGYSLALSAVLFAIGVLAVLIRRNPLVMLMGIELMLNAANLAFVAFARALGQVDGQVAALIFMAVAAAEAAIGLAIIVAVYRRRRDVDADAISGMKG